MKEDRKALSVSQCLAVLNEILGNIGAVIVQGEVTDFRVAKDQLIFFSLKDTKSRIQCFMMRWELATAIENGMLVAVNAVPKIFQTSGGLHLRVATVEPIGAGALQRAYQLLKEKLEREGLFALSRKRALPKYPEHIAVITSAASAAWSDVERVLANRWPWARVSVFHVGVQGAGAIPEIVGALEHLNTLAQLPDVVIVTRGGGSFEDLQAFNAEPVCRAIAASRVPVVCGIGHERDVTLAELAADERGSTPSNCAERATPDQRVVQSALVNMRGSVVREMDRLIADRRVTIRAQVVFLLSSIGHLLARVQRIGSQFESAMQALVRSTQTNLQQLVIRWRALSPHATLKRGYTMIKQAGKIISSAAQIKPPTSLTTIFFDGEVISKIE